MSHKRNISVVGLGYVGLPVAVAFGFHSRVVGFDINPERIAELQNGVDRTHEVDPADLTKTDILFTSDPKGLAQADFHIVAVPTPIDESNRPDLTPVIKASQTVGGKLKKGDIVVYESTVYPGATEEVCVPILEKMSGLTFGRDFTVGYSPERINPGDKEHTFTRITKVVSGSDGPTLEVVAAVYASVITAGVHKAANIKTAEAAKVIENTQRDLNIALINELSMIFHRMGLDTNQVLQAAGTKWNFLPFRPGLVGGHCIGVDPYYLTYKAQMLGYHPEVILAGRRINDGMGRYVAEQVVKGLIRQGNPVKGARVIVFGFTFKEDVPDLRNTRVVDVVRELTEYGLHVQIHDPEARPDEALHEYGMILTPAEELAPADAVVLAVAHKPYQLQGWGLITDHLKGGKGLVVDVKGMLDPAQTPQGCGLWRL